MKTRQEMIYDFMVALSGNPSLATGVTTPEMLWKLASALADEYLGNLA
jgi:hypothetical protein